MSTWQSIETAPLDSGMPHYFLVYTSHENTLMACGMEGELTYLTFMDGLSFDTNCYGKPTHWMPLPKPPAEITINGKQYKTCQLKMVEIYGGKDLAWKGWHNLILDLGGPEIDKPIAGPIDPETSTELKFSIAASRCE